MLLIASIATKRPTLSSKAFDKTLPLSTKHLVEKVTGSPTLTSFFNFLYSIPESIMQSSISGALSVSFLMWGGIAPTVTSISSLPHIVSL